MAFVNQGWSTTVELVSTQNHVRNVILHWDSGVTDETESETARAAWATDYAAVADGGIRSYEHRVRSLDTAFTAPANTTEARDGNAALFICPIAGSPDKTANLILPFPKLSVFVATSGPNMDIVNTALTANANYVANWVGTGTAEISDGEKLAGSILSGHRLK